MSLQKRLDAIRRNFEKTAPAETAEVMHRATDELRASGAAERALQQGAAAPPFVLPDSNGNLVDSRPLLTKGTLVLSFFRGRW